MIWDLQKNPIQDFQKELEKKEFKTEKILDKNFHFSLKGMLCSVQPL